MLLSATILRLPTHAITTALYCLAVSIPLVVGCGGQKTVIEAKKKPRKEGQVAGPAIAIMLHKKQIRSGSRSVTIDRKRVSQVEFHEVSPKAANGSYTATISFRHKQSGGNLRVKAKVTYKIQKTTSTTGIVIENYPVSKVEGLSIEKSD